MFETPNRILTLEPIDTKQFHDADDAWEHINSIYTSSIAFLRSKFQAVLTHQLGHQRYRAFYPEIRLTTTKYDQIDSRLSFGHVPGPGRYSITVTRPDLFKKF
jgi:AMP nucleosidase